MERVDEFVSRFTLDVSRLTEVVRPLLSVVLIVVRVVPLLFTRVSTDVLGLVVVVLLRVDVEVLGFVVVLDAFDLLVVLVVAEVLFERVDVVVPVVPVVPVVVVVLVLVDVEVFDFVSSCFACSLLTAERSCPALRTETPLVFEAPIVCVTRRSKDCSGCAFE